MEHPVVASCRRIVAKSSEVAARAEEVRPRLGALRVERDPVTGETVTVKAAVLPNPKIRGAQAYEVMLNFSARKRGCTCEAHRRYGVPCKHVVALAATLLDVWALTAG